MRTMHEIMEMARAYSRNRTALEEVLAEVQADRRSALAQHRRSLEARAAKAGAALAALKEAVEESRSLFVRPRTQAVDGVRFGLRKQPGRFEVADPDRTIKLIARKMAQYEPDLVRVSRSIVKEGLRHLSAAELASIGVGLGRDTDEVAVTAPRSDLDLLVEALLAEGEKGL